MTDSHHRFAYPAVKEVRLPAQVPNHPRTSRPSQRSLVEASLLRRPGKTRPR
jgi:hypothetical protein